ncbi:hypothetical protein QJS10_CPB20g00999 [Acorus calamus]|uniref:Uncharacterized protein n=1 Tax=Acorus calamus TaxID=4465 RepID=A0AAV9C9R9_ACOCL|nr:hypothetical protein QJS10_CPB20g00999 [Acorus calamus]
MLRMFNVHRRSPIIEIFITVEHNVSSSVLPTPEDREAQNNYSSQRRPPRRPRGAGRRSGRLVIGRDVAGLNPHGGVPTEERGTTRSYCDGDPVMGGPARGYGSGMFSYGTGGRTRGFLGLRGRRPPRGS